MVHKNDDFSAKKQKTKKTRITTHDLVPFNRVPASPYILNRKESFTKLVPHGSGATAIPHA